MFIPFALPFGRSLAFPQRIAAVIRSEPGRPITSHGSLVTQPEVVSRSIRIRHDLRRQRFRRRIPNVRA
jgi:hypothetical protein